MFRHLPDTDTKEVGTAAPTELVPLSHLALDLPVPDEGWLMFLGRRGIAMVPDSLGRDSIGCDAARRLFDEKRENELRAAALRKAAEQAAVEQDQAFRASIGQGVSAAALAGRSYGEAVAEAELVSASASYRVGARRTLLEDALDRSSTMTFHSLADADEEL